MTVAVCLFEALIALQGLDPGAGRHTAPLSASVVLRMSTDRTSYYRGEPVKLHIAVKNIANTPIKGRFLLDPFLGMLELQVGKVGGALAALGDISGNDDALAGTRTLAPGEEYAIDTILALANLDPMNRRFLLNEVGGQQLRAVLRDTLNDPNGVVQSNIVSLDVVQAPAGEQSAQAAYTTSLAYVAQFRTGWSYLSPEITRAALDFIERFPQSRYASSVREGLRRSLDYRIRMNRATDEERALYERLFFDTVAPVLSVSATPSSLWPPNHKLVPITVNVQVTDDRDPGPAVKLVSVVCDDGCDPAGDIVGASLGTDTRQFNLRAERLGSGTGRTYTITYSATDASGNRTTATTTVIVPHDQGDKK